MTSVFKGKRHLNLNYRKVTSSRPVHYSILNSFGQRSQYLCTLASIFPFISSLKILKRATTRDSLLFVTLRYIFFSLYAQMAVLLVMGESATSAQDLENIVQAVALWFQEVPWEPYFQVSFLFHHSFFLFLK